jgi:hypothetical protein
LRNYAVGIENCFGQSALFGKILKAMVEVGLVGFVFLCSADYGDCPNVLEDPVDNPVVSKVKTSIGFKNAKKRLRAAHRVYVYLLFKFLLESVANVLGEFLYVFQRFIGKLRAVHLLLPECVLKRMQLSESGVFF